MPVVALILAFLAFQPSVEVQAGAGAANGSVAERAASSISVGSGFNCWVQNGAAKCIGGNGAGQLGDGTTTSRLAPVTVSGLSTGVISIAAGDAHACALLSTGSTKCWGSNSRGQLGDGTTVNSSTPVQVVGLTSGVARLDAEGENTCALTEMGRALCWGANQTYGTGTITPDANTDGEPDPVLAPAEVSGLSVNVAAIAIAGIRIDATHYFSHGCAVMQTGEVKCWGNNTNGELGTSATSPSATPVVVSLGVTAVALALGSYHSCAMTSAGGVKCWGINTSGQLGNGTTVAVASGTIVDVIGASTGVEQIAAGRSTSCLVTSAGAVMCWGLNIYEIIKRSGTSSNVSTAEVVHGLTSGVYAVSVGDSHICALKTTGDLGCWGANSNGQTGDGYITKILTPQNVVASASSASAMTGFQSIGTSMWSTCGIRTGGGIKCWGYNYSGQLGEYSQSGRPVAIDHTEISSGAVSISVAGTSSTQSLCAIMSDSTVKCWGNNAFGLKGFGSSTAADYVAHTMLASTSPDVALTGITSVSVGPFSTCVVASGAAKCSGGNTAGALGNGTTTASNLPVQVSGLTSGVVAVSTTGANVSCALLNTGEVKCWGNGQQYQLGNGSVANAFTPGSVTGITDATAIASGDYFSCALVTGGAVKCWGNNQYGQMGNGTTATAQTPVSVSGLTGATAIASSGRTVCALMADTTVKCWGWNYWGIFGDGTTTDSSTPVTVPNLIGVTAIAMGATHICALMSDTTMKCWGSEQNGQVGNNTMQNRSFDGQTFVATGLSIPLALPVVVTTTTTTTTTTTSTTTLAPSSTVAPTNTTATTPTTTAPTATVPVAVANKPTNRIDNTVYEIAPALAGAVSAFNIMEKKDARKLRAVTQTPNQCVAGGVRVYTLVPGECRVLVRSIATGKIVRLWQTTVVQSVLTIGSTVRIVGSPLYGRLSDELSPQQNDSLYQEVKNAYAALVVGHTAIFSGNSSGNISLSERRAWNMRKYLVLRGMEGGIASVGIGARAPINTVLTEKAQSTNRRVTLYYIPKLTTGK